MILHFSGIHFFFFIDIHNAQNHLQLADNLILQIT